MGAAFVNLSSGLFRVVDVPRGSYTLRAVQKGFYSDVPAEAPHHHHEHPLEPISLPEKVGAVMLIGASLVVGLFPGLLMNWIEPCFKSSLFKRLLEGGSL